MFCMNVVGNLFHADRKALLYGDGAVSQHVLESCAQGLAFFRQVRIGNEAERTTLQAVVLQHLELFFRPSCT